VAVKQVMFTRGLSAIIFTEIIGGVFFFFRGKRKKRDEFEEEEFLKNKLLCRFVLDGIGKKVGESVAIDSDILIIKSGSKYLGVPLKHIEEDEKTLLVKGLIDQKKAEEMGEKWRAESFREIDTNEGK
jgi:hypothetical protein